MVAVVLAGEEQNFPKCKVFVLGTYPLDGFFKIYFYKMVKTQNYF